MGMAISGGRSRSLEGTSWKSFSVVPSEESSSGETRDVTEQPGEGSNGNHSHLTPCDQQKLSRFSPTGSRTKDHAPGVSS